MDTEKIKEYFTNGTRKNGKQYGGVYYVKMKQMVASLMKEQNVHYSQIAEVIQCKRVTVYHYLFRMKSNVDVEAKVKANFDDWVNNKKYPVSLVVSFGKPVEYSLKEKID